MTTHAAPLPALYSDAGLSTYLEKINRFPFLTFEEEQNLATRWVDEHDMKAAHDLMLSHLRLVAKIAFTFKGYGLPVTDLISEGNIGLMQAIKKFDPEKGFRLSTYAMWWIKAAMQEYILKSWSLVKIGTTSAQKKLFFNLRRMKNRILESGADRSLSGDEAQEIANELNVRRDEVMDMDMRLYLTDRSVDEKMYGDNDDDSRSLIEALPSNEPMHDAVLAEADYSDARTQLLMAAMEDCLNDRERDIVLRRRLVPDDMPVATLETLSEEYSISRERVRQIEARAMEKMKAFIEERM